MRDTEGSLDNLRLFLIFLYFNAAVVRYTTLELEGNSSNSTNSGGNDDMITIYGR